MTGIDRDGIVLRNADCMDVLPTFADDSVDIVVTSPPYNMGLVPGGNGRGMYRPGANNKGGRFRDGYGLHDDAMPQDAYDDWQRAVLAECWRIALLTLRVGNGRRVGLGHRVRGFWPCSTTIAPGIELEERHCRLAERRLAQGALDFTEAS